MSNELWRKAKEPLAPVSLELGPYFANQALFQPRHLLFSLARYKFAAKLLADKGPMNILELGCAEGLGTVMLTEGGNTVTAVDFDEESILHAQKTLQGRVPITFQQDDFLAKSYGSFDAVVSLDVIEHIEQNRENEFLQTITSSLQPHGMCVVGTPNDTASEYASEPSQIGHVNLFENDRLVALFQRHFQYVFSFGMNDEVAHTGFPSMRHYLMVLACHKKDLAD